MISFFCKMPVSSIPLLNSCRLHNAVFHPLQDASQPSPVWPAERTKSYVCKETINLISFGLLTKPNIKHIKPIIWAMSLYFALQQNQDVWAGYDLTCQCLRGVMWNYHGPLNWTTLQYNTIQVYLGLPNCEGAIPYKAGPFLLNGQFLFLYIAHMTLSSTSCSCVNWSVWIPCWCTYSIISKVHKCVMIRVH